MRVADTRNPVSVRQSGVGCGLVRNSVQYNDDIIFWQGKNYDNRVDFWHLASFLLRIALHTLVDSPGDSAASSAGPNPHQERWRREQIHLKSMGLPKTGGVFLIHFHNHHAILANGH